MKQTLLAVNPFNRTWHKLLLGATSLAKPLGLPLLVLAFSMCATTSAFSQATLTVSPNPVAAGQPITVDFQSGACGTDEAFLNPDSSINASGVPKFIKLTLRQDGSYIWEGTYTTIPDDAGSDTISLNTNGCIDAALTVPVTIVRLNGFKWSPQNPGWTNAQAVDTNGDIAVLKDTSSPAGSVTVSADLTPSTPQADSLLDWSGSSSWITNWDYDSSGNIVGGDVSRSSPCEAPFCATIDNFVSNWYLDLWVFWAKISVNTSANFDTDDRLDFSKSGNPGPGLQFPLSPGQVAGPFANQVQATYTACNISANTWLSLAQTKVEIKGTLQPAGVGRLGNFANFSFNSQMMNLNVWPETPSPPSPILQPDPLKSSSGRYVADTSCSGSGFNTDVTQKVDPVNDKIFAIDGPGVQWTPLVTYGYYVALAQAVAFEDTVYVGGDNITPASDTAYWHSFVKGTFSLDHVDMDYSANQDILPNAPVTLPLSMNDPNWGTLTHYSQH